MLLLGVVALFAAGIVAGAGLAAPDRPSVPPSIPVRVMARARPAVIELTGPRRARLEARGERLLVDGSSAAQPLEMPDGRWHLRVQQGRAGAPPAAGLREEVRTYEGRLELRARGGELVVVVLMALEAYVAGVTASETEPGTPIEALRAQAVVARSYALSSGWRHPEARACDMAHCQVLAGRLSRDHRRAGIDAARFTAGRVLRLSDGQVARPPFHAACGGHTADPLEVFGGEDRTGAAAVPDPDCAPVTWRARLPRTTVEEAAAEALRRGGLAGAPPALPDLELEEGRGGYLVRVVDRRRGLAGSGDVFVRALGAAAGWDVVRGNRMRMVPRAGFVAIEGSSLGHGVGLCQAGAVRMARAGADHAAILGRYFPRAAFSVDPAGPLR